MGFSIATILGRIFILLTKSEKLVVISGKRSSKVFPFPKDFSNLSNFSFLFIIAV